MRAGFLRFDEGPGARQVSIMSLCNYIHTRTTSGLDAVVLHIPKKHASTQQSGEESGLPQAPCAALLHPPALHHQVHHLRRINLILPDLAGWQDLSLPPAIWALRLASPVRAQVYLEQLPEMLFL